MLFTHTPKFRERFPHEVSDPTPPKVRVRLNYILLRSLMVNQGAMLLICRLTRFWLLPEIGMVMLMLMLIKVKSFVMGDRWARSLGAFLNRHVYCARRTRGLGSTILSAGESKGGRQAYMLPRVRGKVAIAYALSWSHSIAQKRTHTTAVMK